MIKPYYEELAKTNTDMKFLRVDIDKANSTMPGQLNSVNGVPTFHFYKDGKIVYKFSGPKLTLLRQTVKKLKPTEKEIAQKEEVTPVSYERKRIHKRQDRQRESESEPQIVEHAHHENEKNHRRNNIVDIHGNYSLNSLVENGKSIVFFHSDSSSSSLQYFTDLYERVAHKCVDMNVQFFRINMDNATDSEMKSNIVTKLPAYVFFMDGEKADELYEASKSQIKTKTVKLLRGQI